MTAPKRILIINGSPRRDGIVSRSLDIVRQRSESAGAECERIDICDCRFAPCTGCMACRKSGKCPLPHDDAHELAEKIGAADILVIGTPTYWGGMSAQLKMAFERMVPLFMGESPRGLPQPRMKGRRALLIAACTTPWPFNIVMHQSRGAVRAMREIVSTAGMKVRSVELAGTKSLHGEPTGRMCRKIDKMTTKILK
ncbi:MAG: flavodoxin family protein [Alistipes sp.]|nr:flavodoxin family protein [Alistipes sp.]MDE7130153.1 flavodoxin family protein [Alistipes sp.]